MKSLVVLLVGLVVTGAAMSFSGFALAAPTAIQSSIQSSIQSYLYSIPEPGTAEMLLAGAALMLFVSSRAQPKIH